MMSIRSQSKRATNKMKVLRRHLRQVTISPRLSGRMQKQALERLQTQVPLTMESVDVLKMLSLSLRLELKFELCGSHLKRHPLFCICATLDLQIVQRICFNVVSFLLLAFGDHIFLPGEGAAQVPAAGDHPPAAQHGWDYTIVLLAVPPFVLKVLAYPFAVAVG